MNNTINLQRIGKKSTMEEIGRKLNHKTNMDKKDNKNPYTSFFLPIILDTNEDKHLKLSISP